MKMLILRYKLDENAQSINDGLVVEEAAFCEGKTDDLTSMEFSFYGKDKLEYARAEFFDKYATPETEKKEDSDTKENVEFGAFVYTGQLQEFVEPDRVAHIDLTSVHPLRAVSDVFGDINNHKKI